LANALLANNISAGTNASFGEYVGTDIVRWRSKGQRQMVLDMINTVFAQDSQEAAI